MSNKKKGPAGANKNNSTNTNPKEDIHMGANDNNNQTNNNTTPFNLSNWATSLGPVTLSMWTSDKPDCVVTDELVAVAYTVFNAIMNGTEAELFAQGQIFQGCTHVYLSVGDQGLLRIERKKKWFSSNEYKIDLTRFALAIPFWDAYDRAVKMAKAQAKINSRKEKKMKKSNPTDPSSSGMFTKIKEWIKKQLLRTWVVISRGGISIVVGAWLASFLGTTLIEMLISWVLIGLVWYVMLPLAPLWVSWVLLGLYCVRVVVATVQDLMNTSDTFMDQWAWASGVEQTA